MKKIIASALTIAFAASAMPAMADHGSIDDCPQRASYDDLAGSYERYRCIRAHSNSWDMVSARYQLSDQTIAEQYAFYGYTRRLSDAVQAKMELNPSYDPTVPVNIWMWIATAGVVDNTVLP